MTSFLSALPPHHHPTSPASAFTPLRPTPTDGEAAPSGIDITTLPPLGGLFNAFDMPAPDAPFPTPKRLATAPALETVPPLPGGWFVVPGAPPASQSARAPRAMTTTPTGAPSRSVEPHFPTSLEIKPHCICLAGQPWPMATADALCGDTVDLCKLTPALLDALSPADLQMVTEVLSKFAVKLRWRDARGHTHSGKRRLYDLIRVSTWDDATAAAALALGAGAAHCDAALATMLACQPDAVLPVFRDAARASLTAPVVTSVVVSLVEALAADAPADKSCTAARAIGDVVQRYLEYWARDDPQQGRDALEQLGAALRARANMGADGGQLSAQQVGILLGGLLAGSLKHAHRIRAMDERRLLVVAVTSNLLWAATGFIPLTPVAGALAVGFVGTAVAYGVIRIPRDFSSLAKEVGGQIEMETLRCATPENTLEILQTLAWMRAAVHVNGLAD